MSFIHQAFRQSINAIGICDPNPSVGAVIEFNGEIIGRGSTQSYGGKHAEIMAIDNVLQYYDSSILAKSTLYVTLEPCSHHGKTPPCTDAILFYKIPKVIIGHSDISEKVEGLELLKKAGVNVEIFESESLWLEKFWTLGAFDYSYMRKKPRLLLKWAQTAEGLMSPGEGSSGRISNATSLELMHRLRRLSSAILVTPGTIVTDMPALNSRYTQEINLSSKITLTNFFMEMLTQVDKLPNIEKIIPARYFMLPAIRINWTRENLIQFLNKQISIPGKKIFFTTCPLSYEIVLEKILPCFLLESYEDINPVIDHIYRDGALQVLVESGPGFLNRFIEYEHTRIIIVFESSIAKNWNTKSIENNLFCRAIQQKKFTDIESIGYFLQDVISVLDDKLYIFIKKDDLDFYNKVLDRKD